MARVSAGRFVYCPGPDLLHGRCSDGASYMYVRLSLQAWKHQLTATKTIGEQMLKRPPFNKSEVCRPRTTPQHGTDCLLGDNTNRLHRADSVRVVGLHLWFEATNCGMVHLYSVALVSEGDHACFLLANDNRHMAQTHGQLHLDRVWSILHCSLLYCEFGMVLSDLPGFANTFLS